MRQYEIFELQFAGAEPAGSHVEIDLTAEFTVDGESTKVRGFYAGEGIYKVRFLPMKPGAYHYEVNGILAACGDVTCEPAAEGVHGPVRAVETHFEYADGSLYRPFGTTVYALVHQPEKLIAETIASLHVSPFNKVRLTVFPKHYAYNKNDPEYYPFVPAGEGAWDVHHPDFAFWDHLEKYLLILADLGIECDLIVFHPYDRWGFSKLPLDQALTYLDYLTRRLSSFPQLWWSLANEYDLLDYQKSDWETIAEYLSTHEQFKHLLSNHEMVIPWDYANKDTTHICHQTSDIRQVAPEIQKYGKPLMIDECRYEGNLPESWGNISAREMVHRFWLTCVQGGYCTHGETYRNEDGTIWWAMGGRLHGDSPARIRFLREVLESLPGPLVNLEHVKTREELASQLEMMRKMNSSDPLMRLFASASFEQVYRFIDGHRQMIGHCGEEAYLNYLGQDCPCVCTMKLPETRKYKIEILDSWNMTRMQVMTGVSGETEVKLPGREGIAVLATAEE